VVVLTPAELIEPLSVLVLSCLDAHILTQLELREVLVQRGHLNRCLTRGSVVTSWNHWLELGPITGEKDNDAPEGHVSASMVARPQISQLPVSVL
jgi:hypothetical protein